MITGVRAVPRICRRTSRPSPSGSITSSRTRSGEPVRKASSPSATVPATTGENPSRDSAAASGSEIDSSSSITRMRRLVMAGTPRRETSPAKSTGRSSSISWQPATQPNTLLAASRSRRRCYQKLTEAFHVRGRWNVLSREAGKVERMDSDRRDSLTVDAALLAVVLMWSSTFVLFKIAWHDIDPVAFTALRFASMVVFALVVLAFGRGHRVRIRRGDLPWIAASGLTGYFLYQMSFVLGLDRTTALASSILVATHPIFSVVFMWLAGRGRPRRMEVAGVIVGFLGVAVFLRAWDAFAAATLGDLLSLLAAAAFGAYGVINQPLVRRYPSRELMAYSLLIGGGLVAVVGAPAMLHQDWGRVGGAAWAILAFAIV